MAHPFFNTTKRPWLYPLLISPVPIENPIGVRPTSAGTAGSFAIAAHPFTPTITAAITASVSNGVVTNDDISAVDARFGAMFFIECARPVISVLAVYGGNGTHNRTAVYNHLPLHADPTKKAASDSGYYTTFTGPFTTARRMPYASSANQAMMSWGGAASCPFLCVRRTASGSYPSFSVPVTLDIVVNYMGTVEYGVPANIVWAITDGMPIGMGYVGGVSEAGGAIGVGYVHQRKMQISGNYYQDVRNAYVTPADTKLLAKTPFSWALNGKVSNYVYGPSGSLVFDVSMSINYSYS